MRRLICVLLLIMLFAPAHRADAGVPAPICHIQSVLDVMRHELKRRGYYGRIDPELVFEQPNPARNVNRCAVCVLTASYDMLRFDDHPVLQCGVHVFDVRTVPNGFVVRALQ